MNLYCQYSQMELAVVRLCDDTGVYSFIFVSMNKEKLTLTDSCRMRYWSACFRCFILVETCVCYECCSYRELEIVWLIVCQLSCVHKIERRTKRKIF